MWNLRLTSFRAGGKSLNIFATRLSRFFSFSRPHRVAGLGRLRARSALFFHRINGSSFVKLRCCDGGFAKPGETLFNTMHARSASRLFQPAASSPATPGGELARVPGLLRPLERSFFRTVTLAPHCRLGWLRQKTSQGNSDSRIC